MEGDCLVVYGALFRFSGPVRFVQGTTIEGDCLVVNGALCSQASVLYMEL